MSISFNRRAAEPLTKVLRAAEARIATEQTCPFCKIDYGKLRMAFFEAIGRWPGKERLTNEIKELRDDSLKA